MFDINKVRGIYIAKPQSDEFSEFNLWKVCEATETDNDSCVDVYRNNGFENVVVAEYYAGIGWVMKDIANTLWVSEKLLSDNGDSITKVLDNLTEYNKYVRENEWVTEYFKFHPIEIKSCCSFDTGILLARKVLGDAWEIF